MITPPHKETVVHALDRIQPQIRAWVERSFPETDTDTGRIAILFEEGGEMSRAIVKRQHGHRGTYEEWTANLRKELAQTMMVLLDIAEREGFSATQAVLDEWAEVEPRDLNHDPISKDTRS